jgi:cob(I)alamin adenosyltransferase
MTIDQTRGLIIVHTGNGKGKTSAALGMALRTVAHGWKVAIVQFIKKEDEFDYGEHRIKNVLPGWDIFPMGAGFTWNTKDKELDIRTTLNGWEKCKETAFSGEYQLVIFDEINYVIDYEYLSLDPVLEFLRNKPHALNVVLTGRNARPEIIDIADLVTEMKEIKHPFKKGIRARKGLEF